MRATAFALHGFCAAAIRLAFPSRSIDSNFIHFLQSILVPIFSLFLLIIDSENNLEASIFILFKTQSQFFLRDGYSCVRTRE